MQIKAVFKGFKKKKLLLVIILNLIYYHKCLAIYSNHNIFIQYIKNNETIPTL